MASSDAYPRILIVDDEPEIRSMLNIFLSIEDFEVTEADCGKVALRQTIAAKPDLVILDLGLPDIDGQEVIRSIRQFSNMPIIVLTARNDDKQVVEALMAGADDYVVKPFRIEVLLARINANLRGRDRKDETGPVVENGPILMDMHSHQVYLDGQLTPFTPKEFSLLHTFVANKGKMLTHKQILRDVWGPSHADDTQYLRVYIGQIREKLARVEGLRDCIVSEAGIGYRMEPSEAGGAPTVAEAELSLS